MYHHIAGTLESKSPSEAVVDANGVGYVIRIPYSTSSALPEPGRKVRLLTHLHVTEDAHTLFGFATAGEREFFLQLMTVNGVGPKLALAVISGGRVQDIQQAIRLGDYASLRRIKGVGETTAKKIVLELGKILIHQPAAADESAAVRPSKTGLPESAGLDAEIEVAVKAVMQLQEAPQDVALQAVQRAFAELSALANPAAPKKGAGLRPAVQDVVQRAMKYC
jgi:Holliday junction DNA helicase RuvA